MKSNTLICSYNCLIIISNIVCGAQGCYKFDLGLSC